jgi:hypothetical protein
MGGIVSFGCAILSLSLLTAAMQPSVPTTLQSLDSSSRLTILPDAEAISFYNPKQTPLSPTAPEPLKSLKNIPVVPCADIGHNRKF